MIAMSSGVRLASPSAATVFRFDHLEGEVAPLQQATDERPGLLPWIDDKEIERSPDQLAGLEEPADLLGADWLEDDLVSADPRRE